MALEPSGNSASDQAPREQSKVQEPPLVQRASAGFAESNSLFRTVFDLPAELRPLQGLLDPVFLRWAARRAEALGIGTDLVVGRDKTVDSDAMLSAYSADLGMEIETLEGIANANVDVTEILQTGVLPSGVLAGKTGPTVVCEGERLRSFYEDASRGALDSSSATITTRERLRDFVIRSFSKQLAEEAAYGLRKSYPEYSADIGSFGKYILGFFIAAAIAGLTYYLSLHAVIVLLETAIAVTFLSWASLRIYACLLPSAPALTVSASDQELPFYSILVPLHREAAVVADLVAAISALNYPREKLEVKLILEPDDPETLAAINGIRLDPCFETIIASPLGPRTKPKALRAAMPFVRGDYLVIYDAEDRPHPDQLRDAYAKFCTGAENLACVQAKLAIDNKRSNFLTAHFRAEYSGIFEVLLPAIVQLQLPVPLGGTSNHFRTDILRKVGSWDPHNVTEDADLGIRLTRFGYAIDVVGSRTGEEAPERIGAWLMQRTRWMKGWLQTLFVHMRNPVRLYQQLGWRRFIAFQLLIGGTVLAALLHPFFLGWLLIDAFYGTLLMEAVSPQDALKKSVVFLTLASGYFASGLLAFVGLWRSKQFASAWILPTIPIYWLLLSLAAWRAVWKLVRAPYHWEKTEHGIAARCPESHDSFGPENRIKAGGANPQPPHPLRASD